MNIFFLIKKVSIITKFFSVHWQFKNCKMWITGTLNKITENISVEILSEDSFCFHLEILKINDWEYILHVSGNHLIIALFAKKYSYDVFTVSRYFEQVSEKYETSCIARNLLENKILFFFDISLFIWKRYKGNLAQLVFPTVRFKFQSIAVLNGVWNGVKKKERGL